MLPKVEQPVPENSNNAAELSTVTFLQANNSIDYWIARVFIQGWHLCSVYKGTV